MNKQIKKWIRRTLLWGIGIPVALVLLLYLLLESAWRIAPEKVDGITYGVISRILNIDIYDEQEHDFKLINNQFDRKNYDSVHVVCDSLEGRTKVFQADLHFFHGVAYVLQKQTKVAEFQFRKSIAAFSGDEAELTTYANSVRLLSQLLMEKHDYVGALEVLMPAMETIKAHQKSILHLMPSATSNLYTAMGNCLVALGRYGEADRHYHEAIASYERNQSTILLDGESIDSDTTFIEVKVNAAGGAALAYIGQQRYDEAGAWFSTARENYQWLQKHADMSKPKYRRTVFMMALAEARLLHHQGRTSKAFQTFHRVWTT